MKDARPYAPTASRGCYWRIDGGYSWNRTPDGDFVFEDADNDGANAQRGKVTDAKMDNSGLLEVGYGCSPFSLSGFRTELTAGVRFKRNFDAVPPQPPAPNDPLHTNLTTWSLMTNLYYDFNAGGRFMPYIGVGVGLAYHMLEDVAVDPIVSTPYTFGANNDLQFAWQLMAGVGYQVSNRVTLDVGYRYVDMGRIASQHNSVGHWYESGQLTLNDLTAHEFKVGVRVNMNAPTLVAYK